MGRLYQPTHGNAGCHKSVVSLTIADFDTCLGGFVSHQSERDVVAIIAKSWWRSLWVTGVGHASLPMAAAAGCRPNLTTLASPELCKCRVGRFLRRGAPGSGAGVSPHPSPPHKGEGVDVVSPSLVEADTGARAPASHRKSFYSAFFKKRC